MGEHNIGVIVVISHDGLSRYCQDNVNCFRTVTPPAYSQLLVLSGPWCAKWTKVV